MRECPDTEKMREEHAAKVRLEKAAPDMLAALEAIVEAYGCECIEGELSGHCPMCQGRAAITKARG